MKKISVIIPCFNVENFIDRTFRSLEAQTIGFENLEVICVNDASKDNTLSKLKEWESEYPDNVLVIDMESNVRQGAARNIGLQYASCDYIAFLDADDWTEKEYLEKMLVIAIDGNYDIVQCGYVRDSNEKLTYNQKSSATSNPSKSIRIETVNDRKKVFHSKVITNTPPLKLIKRNLLVDNNILFSEGLAYEDSYWGVLLNMYATSVYLLDEPLYHYYINPNSTVLSKNELYHVDLVTTQCLLWNELLSRGFMTDYKDEIEIEFVYSCALIFWKMMIYRYDDPPYSLYRLLCVAVKDHVPNIMDNIYVRNGDLSEFHLLLLNSCLKEMTKSDFIQFAANVRKIGL